MTTEPNPREIGGNARLRSTRRVLDPTGRRALFEMPVAAARDTIRQGRPKEGRDALFSSGPRQRGSVVVECSHCEARTRISLSEVALRMMTGSVWLPVRRHAHHMRCPACGHRSWCRIGWTE
ncbi:MAG: hypothetical protein HYX34_00985 [Actinobacteria bacterium]|nr:hypothetical protein [Actinomycetota bacterium]